MVTSNILSRAAYLLLWPLSIPWANPEWPGPCLSNSVQTHPRVSIASAIDLGAASSHYQSSCLAQTNALDTLIRRVPICITWTKSWAGELGTSMLFRVQVTGKNTVRIEYTGDDNFLDLPDLVEKLNHFGGMVEAKLRPGADPQEILKVAVARGVRLTRFELVEPPLHDIFIEKVSEAHA